MSIYNINSKIDSITSNDLVQNGIQLHNLFKSIERDNSNLFNNLTNGNNLVKKKNGADIWEFISAFNNGFAKPTRYRIELNLPSGAIGSNVNLKSTVGVIRGVDSDLNKNGSISIKCHTMMLPSRNLNTFEVTQNNMKFKMPYGVTYEPLTFSFYADSQLDTLRYFEIWQATTMNFSDNTMNFFDEYTSDINLYLIDDEGNDVYGVKLIQAYPTNIGQVDLSYSNVNNIINVNVTFNFKYFTSMESTDRINRAY